MEGEGREALRQEAEGTDEPCRRANPSRLPLPSPHFQSDISIIV